jgi:hypothetical protein
MFKMKVLSQQWAVLIEKAVGTKRPTFLLL